MERAFGSAQLGSDVALMTSDATSGLMTIPPSDLVFIKRALLNNSVVLYTGAGFSRDARNISDEPMPTGDALADKLWAHLGYEGTRTKETLPQLFEAAIGRGHGPLRDLLQRSFECKSYASWYRLVAEFYWYRVYTTNIDSVLEKTYADAGGSRLRRIDGQKGDYVDRDQFLNEIQYVKLNGADWTSPQDVTFSFRQYARRSSEAPVWYEQLARDFVTRVVLFVGSEIDEPLFWSALELRGKKFGDGEKRPKSFWIKPSFTPVALENLKKYHVIGLQGTAKEFFELLAAETKEERNKAEVLQSTHPNFATLAAAVMGVLNKKQNHDFEAFYSVHVPVLIPDRVPSCKKSFLLGASPDWPALLNHLDAPRTCTGDLTKLIDAEFATKKMSIVCVSGHAGSGKSTILRRLALDLRAKGHLVLWSDSENHVPQAVFESVINSLSARPIIFLDNVTQIRAAFVGYLSVMNASAKPPVFIVADRTNKLFHLQSSLATEYRVQPFGIPNLSQIDIESLLETLKANGLLGKLAGMPHARQIYEFSIRAGKQLLVAMREATSGLDFDQIIDSEFKTLSSDEIKIVYLAVCLATAAGYSLTQQQYVALSDLEPNQALGLLDGELKDVVITLGTAKPGLVARHRIIAALVVDTLAPRETLQRAYVRLLAVISKDVSYPVKMSAKSFRLYRAVINHQSIWSRFPGSTIQAREIFESVRNHVGHDSHFWLQYGSLELEYGELELAEVYVLSAESLSPTDDIVQNTKGLLAYKRAIASDRVMMAVSLRENARKILIAQWGKNPDGDYAPHIFHQMELAYIKAWVSDREERKRSIKELKESIDLCLKTHRFSERLSLLKKSINDYYLEQAISE